MIGDIWVSRVRRVEPSDFCDLEKKEEEERNGKERRGRIKWRIRLQ